MYAGTGVSAGIVLVLLVCSSGCLDSFYAQPVPPQATPLLPVVITTPESPVVLLSPANMALQPSDLPGDYFLKDRSVIAPDEMPALNRDLGWRQGYRVEYYRMNLDRGDITGVTQTIDLYPLENMNKLFSVEKDALLAPDPVTDQPEIPFPVIGDRSIAVRKTRSDDPYQMVTYTAIFTDKNVFEKITMAGTTTDYEVFRNITRAAAGKIR